MSIVINSNAAATLAANNLAASSSNLQKSLNRLSSGSKIVSPADDAAGLAVSMKFSAAAHRQSAARTNVGNTVSFLQTQDGALKVTGKVLDRISELKTLYSDPTKNSTDKANYDAEFSKLQAQITAIGSETFNGKTLFGTSSLSVGATEDGATTVAQTGVNLLGTSSAPAWANISGVAPASGWTESNASINNSGGFERFHADGTLTTTQSNITGPYTINFTYNLLHTGTGTATLSAGGSNSLDIHAQIGSFDAADHTMAITVDASGNASWSFDSGAQTGTVANFASTTGSALAFAVTGSSTSDLHVKNDFTLTSTGGGGSTGNVASVVAASSLGTLALSAVTGAIADVATHRAGNGATQSRLGFADELLTVNQANLEAANSRITDVDVAAESTQMARYNILVQSGTAMLSQANQSAQTALRLIQ